jgi:MFS family permease
MSPGRWERGSRSVLKVVVLGELLAALMMCSPALAQGGGSDDPTSDDARGPDRANERLRSAGSLGPRTRRALNLEAAGWIIATVSAPALAFVASDDFCRERLAALPAVSFGLGISMGIAGSVLRARRTEGVPRMRFLERQRLFRSPGLRALGLAGLVLGTLAASFVPTVVYTAFSCRA